MSRRILSAASRGRPEQAGGPGEATRGTGLGRIIVAVYGILALAATVRAVYQILAEFDEAPLAYTLSLFSGLVYILATVTLAGSGRRTWAWSVAAVSVELIGVVVVGVLSLTIPGHFAHASVWSGFGSGYGYIPLVLPVVGLWWLFRHRPVRP